MYMNSKIEHIFFFNNKNNRPLRQKKSTTVHIQIHTFNFNCLLSSSFQYYTYYAFLRVFSRIFRYFKPQNSPF